VKEGGVLRRAQKENKGTMEEKRLITLIGAKLAEEGGEFIFLGAFKKCDECRLKNSCTNLEADRRYRIAKVREEIKHDCYIHEGGVCVVEVEEAPITVAIEAPYTFKNSKIVFEPPNCNDYLCELFNLCRPSGLNAGDQCMVLEVLGPALGECKKGRNLKKVTVRRESK
jgi:uncharacterized protein (UPF0179 family)